MFRDGISAGVAKKLSRSGVIMTAAANRVVSETPVEVCATSDESHPIGDRPTQRRLIAEEAPSNREVTLGFL